LDFHRLVAAPATPPVLQTNKETVAVSTNLTFTMFQPRLKSGAAGVVDKFRRGAVYEVVVDAMLEWFAWMQNSSSAKLSRNTFQSYQIGQRN